MSQNTGKTETASDTKRIVIPTFNQVKAIVENKFEVSPVDHYRKWAVGDNIDLTIPESERDFVVADTLPEAINLAIEKLV
jgi:hypothetical protein